MLQGFILHVKFPFISFSIFSVSYNPLVSYLFLIYALRLKKKHHMAYNVGAPSFIQESFYLFLTENMGCYRHCKERNSNKSIECVEYLNDWNLLHSSYLLFGFDCAEDIVSCLTDVDSESHLYESVEIPHGFLHKELREL